MQIIFPSTLSLKQNGYENNKKNKNPTIFFDFESLGDQLSYMDFGQLYFVVHDNSSFDANILVIEHKYKMSLKN